MKNLFKIEMSSAGQGSDPTTDILCKEKKSIRKTQKTNQDKPIDERKN